jgi:hypothetical protein
LGRAPIGAGIIREVRRSLGIDRPRAITYARKLLAKNPTLEVKKVIGDARERFGISLGAPDVSRLRPAGARRKKVSSGERAPRTTAKAQPVKKAQPPSREISANYKATGPPEEVAHFFRSLAQ